MQSKTSCASASSLANVVGIAGGDQRQAHLLCDFDRALDRLLLDVEAVVLDFDEVPIAKQLVKPSRDFLRPGEFFLVPALPDKRARLNSPETQPDRQMIPSWYCSSSSRSIRGL